MADSSDLDRQIEQLKKCEIIKEAEVKALCAKAREILIEESNVQRVDSPVTVIVFICHALSKLMENQCRYNTCILYLSVFRFVEIFMDNSTI